MPALLYNTEVRTIAKIPLSLLLFPIQISAEDRIRNVPRTTQFSHFISRDWLW
jgi:hypothetical protein